VILLENFKIFPPKELIVKKYFGLFIAIILLAGCATTLPTFNPDLVAEESLVEVSVRPTQASNIDASWTILAINGVPLDQELETSRIESNENSDDANGVFVPAGQTTFTFQLSNGFAGRRSLYMDQELEVTFTLEAGTAYLLSREASLLSMGQTAIVLRKPGFLGLVNPKVDEAIVASVGLNKYEVRQ
jgi:hypothetical protein